MRIYCVLLRQRFRQISGTEILSRFLWFHPWQTLAGEDVKQPWEVPLLPNVEARRLDVAKSPDKNEEQRTPTGSESENAALESPSKSAARPSPVKPSGNTKKKSMGNLKKKSAGNLKDAKARSEEHTSELQSP